MSQGPILRALKRGPMTTSQLLKITGSCPADISRTCSGLRHIGKIKRIDGGSGRGSIAIYALTDSTAPIPEIQRPPRHNHYVAPSPDISDAHFVAREPCLRCGTRGDIGCKHQVATSC